MGNKGSFVKGDPRAGRKPGVPNKATLEVKEWARGVLEDQDVRETTLRLAKSGRLAPAIQIELYNRAYGKVKDTLALEGDVKMLSDEELAAKAVALAAFLGAM